MQRVSRAVTPQGTGAHEFIDDESAEVLKNAGGGVGRRFVLHVFRQCPSHWGHRFGQLLEASCVPARDDGRPTRHPSFHFLLEAGQELPACRESRRKPHRRGPKRDIVADQYAGRGHPLPDCCRQNVDSRGCFKRERQYDVGRDITLVRDRIAIGQNG